MNYIISWYNQKRRRIWAVVVIIVLIICVTRTLGNSYKKITEEESSSTNSSTTTSVKKKDTNYAVISATKISDNETKNLNTTIESFVNYCNNGDIENAYNMLSEDCKEELYQNIEIFKNNYYLKIFNNKKTYDIQAWIANSNGYTYLIKFKEDILATGKSSVDYIEDYYTITNGGKLNINGFIAKEDINSNNTEENVTISVINCKIYRDCETYEINMKNNSTKKIILDSKKSTKTIYIEDEGVNYYADLYELADEDLIFNPGNSKTLKITFSKIYREKRQIKSLKFTDVNSQSDNKNDTFEIKIEL